MSGANSPSSRTDKASTGGASLITIYRHMLARLTVATAAIMSVIVIEQILHKSPQLYDLVMSGALSPDRLLLIWLHILPVIFYHATPEIVSIAVACRYYQWIENNEVLSLRSAGRSSCQIACPGIIVAVLAASFCALNSLCLLPLSLAESQTSIPGGSKCGCRGAATGLPAGDHPRRMGRVRPTEPGRPHSRGYRGAGWSQGTFIHRNLGATRTFFRKRCGISLLLLDNGAYFVRTTTGIEKVDFDTFSLPVGIAEGMGERPRGFYGAPPRLLNPPAEVRNDTLTLAQWLVEGHRRIVNPLLCVGNVVLVLGCRCRGDREGGKRFCSCSQ